MLFQSQIRQLRSRKEFLISFFCMMVLAVGSFVFNCIQQYGADVTRYISADKLFLGRNGSNDLAVLLPFLLPLLFVLPFADSYITDRQHYILPAILSRASARQYYFIRNRLKVWIRKFRVL